MCSSAFRHTAPRIAVIGGGISGLAAAHRITELLPHAELTLMEASARLGGVLDTVHRDGFLIERSADNFLTKLPVALELCRRLGIADELLTTDDSRRRALVVRDGRLLPIPDGFFLMAPRKLRPILASPVLSLSAKLRLLAEPFVKPSPCTKGQGDGASGSSEHADESVAAFARRRLGREVFERLVQPLVSGIYTADPEKLSMAATMPEFLAQERIHGSLLFRFRGEAISSHEAHIGGHPANSASGARYSLFVAPKHGIATLTTALADRLPSNSVQLNSPVTSIQFTAEGEWQVDLESQSSSGPRPTFHAVVLAIPAHAAARLLESLDPELATALASIEYAGCNVVSLGFDRGQIAHPLNGFGFVVPQIENRRVIAASFASQKFPGRAPAGAVLVRTFIGGALRPDLLNLPDAELRQIALEELGDLLHIAGEPRVADIARWPRAMPQYHVGHLDRIARIEERAGCHATLALAGNAYYGVGIPQCIASGEAAAERIAARFTS